MPSTRFRFGVILFGYFLSLSALPLHFTLIKKSFFHGSYFGLELSPITEKIKEMTGIQHVRQEIR